MSNNDKSEQRKRTYRDMPVRRLLTYLEIYIDKISEDSKQRIMLEEVYHRLYKPYSFKGLWDHFYRVIKYKVNFIIDKIFK